MNDSHRLLNYSHEYQLVWLESADFSADQIAFATGTIFNTTASAKQAKSLFVRGSDTASLQVTYWSTPFDDGVWHNFGLLLDFNVNKVEVWYSRSNGALRR